MRGEINDWTAVEEIQVDTFQRTMTLSNQIRPETVHSAQYSVPFCVAAAALHGARCLQPMSKGLLADEQVLALAAKVRLEVDPVLDAAFPASVPARVTITTKGAPMVRHVPAPKGEATNPMSWDELMQKLQTAALPHIGGEVTSSLENALVSLRDGTDIGPLLACLSGKCGKPHEAQRD